MSARPPAVACLLVVEGDDLQRSVQCEYLVDSGYRVREARTVAEAKSDPTIGLVVANVSTPGQSAPEALAQELTRSRPTLPVILTSATGRRHSLRAANHRFMAKPYSLADLALPAAAQRQFQLLADLFG